MKVTRQKCIAHFKGVDGLGTCNTMCQWYHPRKVKGKTKRLKNSICPNGTPTGELK